MGRHTAPASASLVQRLMAAASLALAMGGVLGAALSLSANGDTERAYGASAPVVVEDSAAWDCTTMGNRICGPGNAQGAPAGRYDEGGVPLPAGYDLTDSGIAQWEYDHGLPIQGYGVDESKVGDRSLPYGWAAQTTEYDLAMYQWAVLCQDPSDWYGDGDEFLNPDTGQFMLAPGCAAVGQRVSA